MAHLPGFVALADKIKDKGVDAIACLSVNDAFVMDAWGKGANAEELLMVSDWDAGFQGLGPHHGRQRLWPGRALSALCPRR